MRAAVICGTVLALAAGRAAGQELVATKPGVMCRSADALGRLTLPGGDSRTHGAAGPADMALAASGGCIDIARGARVTVQQAFRNTSIVSYGAPGAPPYVVPNADFEQAGPGGPAQAATSTANGLPSGYAVTQRIAVAAPGSGILVLLQDRRLTPRLRQELWGTGGPDVYLDPKDPLVADVTRHPLLNAKLQLVSASGAVLAETTAERSLAKIEPAPIHGLATPAVLFTVDESAGFGGSNGPDTVLLTPATTQLAPVRYVPDGRGEGGEIFLGSTLHLGWRIVPARSSGPEEIESVFCPGYNDVRHLTLWTYRFRDGQWHQAERHGGECGELEVLPPRSAFP